MARFGKRFLIARKGGGPPGLQRPKNSLGTLSRFSRSPRGSAAAESSQTASAGPWARGFTPPPWVPSSRTTGVITDHVLQRSEQHVDTQCLA